MKNKKKTIAFSLTVLFASIVHAETMVPSFTSVADCTTWVGDYANTIPVTFRSPPSNSYFHDFFHNFAYAHYGSYSFGCTTSNGSTTCVAKWGMDSHNRAADGGCQFVGTDFFPQLHETLQMEVDNYESTPSGLSLPVNDYGVIESYLPTQTPDINNGTLQTYQVEPGESSN